jgi:hypothetical protein
MKRFALFVLLFWPGLLFGATASPATISGITVAGSTLTVTTATAHGLSATLPSGFCISGSSIAADNVCGVVTGSSSGTTFTFTLAAGAACSSSCGTVLPAKRVVWLQTITVSGGYQVNYLLWLATTSGVAGKSSAWTGASSAENNALGAGALIEIERSQFFPLNTTLANAEAQMANDWSAQQSQLTASVQPGQFFGNFYDGTGWLQ